jgi:sortase A
MKIVIRKASLGLAGRSARQWAQRALFAGAILLLGYCGFVLLDAWAFQYRAMRVLAVAPARSAVAESPPARVIEPGGLIGRIEIERLGVSVVVVEGTDESDLRHSAGHIGGTALPGSLGNIGIAAHRDTFFRPLRNIKHDDIITLTTLQGEYRYRVLSTSIVKPDNLAVLNADEKQILTLVTCYPFYFIGSAPERFIVRAERVT